MSAEQQEIAEYQRDDGALRDGIGEDDHAIPFWFSASFVASVIFAAVYIPFYLFSGWSQVGQYQEEVAVATERVAAVKAAMPTTNPYRGDSAALADGKNVWDTTCVACHTPAGTGLVGPSLVDPYWKYGDSDEALFETVSGGRPMGMPPWGTLLGTEKIWKVLAFMETLPKSDEPGMGSPDYVAPSP